MHQLGAESPKTPDIYTGTPLFGVPFGKVLYFLTPFLKSAPFFDPPFLMAF
jgi:hypothetical protein